MRVERQYDFVAREAELHGADEHFYVPAAAAIAHAERDQRREADRAHRTDPRPAVAIDGVDEAGDDLLAGAAAAGLGAEHELRAALDDRLDEVADHARRRRAIAGDEHERVGHARQPREVGLRAEARGAVAAARLAEDERAAVARDLGGAIGRCAIDDDDRAHRAMREIAEQRAEADGVIAGGHDHVDQQRRRHDGPSIPGPAAPVVNGRVAITYKDAGVDIDAGNALVDRIKPLAKSTMRDEVLGGIGGFAALCRIPAGYEQPVLVSGTDGVGTKLKTALAAARHDTIGIDLVAMCVNDVLVTGAEPLFFLDYFATGALDVDTAAAVIAGIAEGCRQAGCALVGGETAELPGLYRGRDYDLAGFCVGVVERAAIRPQRDLAAGDAVIGLPSAGLHSNGHSLARKAVLEVLGLPLDARPAALGGASVADELLRPTIIYASAFAALRAAGVPWKAAAHITGGGLVENPPRIFADEALAVELDPRTWDVPAIFGLIASAGVEADELRRTFNLGLGMVIAVPAEAAERTVALLAESRARVVGRLVPRAGGASSRFVGD